MAKANVPLLSFNRGLISPKGLARVDLDRTKLSAATMRNWLPKTIGPMTIRPGTKWFGSSLRDTGAEFIEFVASTEDVALPEITHQKMRIWLGDDAHELALLGRPKVDTTVSLTDTGWTNASTGGAFATPAIDLIPDMTAATTNGVTVSASSAWVSGGFAAWKAADDDNSTLWLDTGNVVSTLPSWWNVDFGSSVSNRKAVTSYSIRAQNANPSNVPNTWRLIASNFDTGTYATDTGKWTLEDSRTGESGWAVSEKRTYETDQGDTGTVTARRHWRLYFTATNGGAQLIVAEIEMFDAATAVQAKFSSGALRLNATSIGARAKATKRVIVSDTGTEHSLAIQVERGPVTLRVGSTNGDDDYISETSIGTGRHNLAFTPQGNFWITLQSDAIVDRIVSSLSIGDSGTVELTAPWEATDLDNIRYDQSADVVYVDCDDVRPQKIERRGTGRSWSVVNYEPNNGPFLPAASSSAKLSVSYFFGNTTLNSDIPFFTSDHVGALIRIFHNGQSGRWRLGALNAATDPIEVTGISDTGTPGDNSERRIIFSVTGTWAGRITIERSIDGPEIGFKSVPSTFPTGPFTDTGTFTKTIDDQDDNLKVWYRARIFDTGAPGSGYTSGVANVRVIYRGGGVTGIGRITDYSSNTSVGLEVLSRFSDTGPSDNWQQGYWSPARGFPSAVALHGGRLFHAQGGSLFGSVSDDFENFDDGTVGESGPIIRTLGSGSVDNIHYLVSLLRLVIGTTGAELTARSSSLDEPLTPENNSVAPIGTQGSANLRAIRMDTRALMVQRSKKRVYMVGPAQNTIADYEEFDLSQLVPDLMEAGIVSIALQRQPDTRLHCVLADGTVAILTYEPQEEVICWSTWTTDTGTVGTVERAMVLPGISEDAVYYHIRRVINGSTKRYLEKWALESECVGDTGLTWIMDCAKSYTDTGRTATLTGFSHLAGENVVVWSDDTGSIPGVDRSPDVNGVQTTYLVNTGTGNITLSTPVHHAVAGLPFKADWRSTKLAYAAQGGTALTQSKRVAQMGLILHQTHNRALLIGTDTGHLDPLPQMFNGAAVDANEIFETFDQVAFSIDSTNDPDARAHIRAKAPRPATVLAAVVNVQTDERV